MNGWNSLRSTKEAAGFQGSLDKIGIDIKTWDEISPEVDCVLCGAELSALDEVYPVLANNGLRMYLTPEMRGIPALRLAFQIDNEGCVIKVGVDRRSPSSGDL